MKLIGAGLPRTGTLTQKVALEMLGFGPCYHMVNVLGDLGLVQPWAEALAGNADWPTIFDGFHSTVDWPAGFFYRELLEVYPDAKVLLSVRDPATWEKSMRDTVWSVYYGSSLMCHISQAAAVVDPPWQSYLDLMTGLLWEGRGTLADGHDQPAGMIDAMRRHTEAVKRHVPAEQLLIWDPGDGWEPLCAFLGGRLSGDAPPPPQRQPDVQGPCDRHVAREDRLLAPAGRRQQRLSAAASAPSALTRWSRSFTASRLCARRRPAKSCRVTHPPFVNQMSSNHTRG